MQTPIDSILKGISQLLTQNKLTISVAESCTGGNIASFFSSIAGASTWFRGGIVAYTSYSKNALLKISEDLIKKNGIVSKEISFAMAKQIKDALNTDIAIATTGNLGPTKEPGNAPIGEIWVTIIIQTKIISYPLHIIKPRETAIEETTIEILKKLHQTLYKSLQETNNN